MPETSVFQKEIEELNRRKKIKESLKKIRSSCDPKNTKYYHRKEYGHNFTEAHYFTSDGLEFAKVLRTDGEIDFIKIKEETVIFQ